MKILNLSENYAARYKKILDQNKIYWFVNVTHSIELHSILSSIPEETLKLIRNGNIYLCISNEFESFISVPKEIYQSIIVKGKIPEYKIVFLSGAQQILQICQNITSEINEQNKSNLQTLDARFFCGGHMEIVTQNNVDRDVLFIRNLLLQGRLTYKKHFICLNKRWRPHRTSLVALLQSKNLVDFGYISLGANELHTDWPDAYKNILDVHANHTESYTLLVENKDKILSIAELTVDTNNFYEKTIENTRALNKFYERSFMSVVTETNFYNYNINFLSEKTFKPICYLQPFILVSVPKSLEMLRNLGYKTFHPFINESYDLEPDDCKRLMMIVSEIERICALSQQDLSKLSRQVHDICIYNYNLLKAYKNL